jgi:hypothetical protein
MYVIDMALALGCIFFGLAVLVPLVRARSRYQRYVTGDGTVIAPEMAQYMLDSGADVDIDMEWMSTPWQDEADLASEGWQQTGAQDQPVYMAMLGFGGITLLATAIALPLGLGREQPAFAYVTFAVAALFGGYGLFRLWMATRDKFSAHPLNHIHLVLAALALIAGIRLY